MGSREALLAVLLLTAGCLSPGDPPSDDTDTVADAQQPPWTTFRSPVNVSSDTPGAEPVLATASDGTLFIQGLGFQRELTAGGFLQEYRTPNQLWRSTDDGATWREVTPPDLGGNASADGFVAVGNEDTVYLANALGPYVPPPRRGMQAPPSPGHTLQLFRSTDLGDTWERLVAPQVPGDVHRMWLVPEGDQTIHLTQATLGASPDTRPLYYARSDDRGDTWTAPTLVHETRSVGSDLALGPGGNLYIVIWTPDGETDFELARSTDGGASFEALPMVDGGPREGFASSWQSLEAGPNGTLTFVWAQADDGPAQVRYTVSTDQGETWTTPRTVAERPGDQMLPWSSATGPGGLDVVWIQKVTTEGSNATWYPTLARLTGLGSGASSASIERLSAWPIHEGEVCVSAYCSGEGGSRAMLDFSWIEQGPNGLAHAAFTSTRAEANAVPVYVGETAPPTR